MNRELLRKFNEKIAEPISRDLELHVHDDIEELFDRTNIPYVLKSSAEVYIMQGSKVVFIGSRELAMWFIIRRRGELLKEFLSDRQLNNGLKLSKAFNT